MITEESVVSQNPSVHANPQGALDIVSDGENCCCLREDGSHGAQSRWHFHSATVRGLNAWPQARELPQPLILTLKTLGF